RKSVWTFPLGWALVARVMWRGSTSQIAAMVSVFEMFIMSPKPMPPTPTQATLSFSEGGVWPSPRTWRGTMAKAEVTAAAERKVRREGGWGIVVPFVVARSEIDTRGTRGCLLPLPDARSRSVAEVRGRVWERVGVRARSRW